MQARAEAETRARIQAHYRRWLERGRRRLPQRGRGVRVKVVWDRRVADAVVPLWVGRPRAA